MAFSAFWTYENSDAKKNCHIFSVDCHSKNSKLSNDSSMEEIQLAVLQENDFDQWGISTLIFDFVGLEKRMRKKDARPEHSFVFFGTRTIPENASWNFGFDFFSSFFPINHCSMIVIIISIAIKFWKDLGFSMFFLLFQYSSQTIQIQIWRVFAQKTKNKFWLSGAFWYFFK